MGIIQLAEYLIGQLKLPTLLDMEMQISPQIVSYLLENIDEHTILVEDLPDEMTKAESIYGQGVCPA